MRRKSDQSLGQAIQEFLASYHLDKKIQEKKVIQSWEQVAGQMVFKHTTKLTIRKNILYVKIDSAALRNELSFAREKLVRSLNKAAGAEVISEIVIH